MPKLYRRKPQPDVRAIQWDGSLERLDRIQRAAGTDSHQVITWKWENTDDQLGMSIMTEAGDQQVSHGDWILFTEDGLYVSKARVFEKWYEEV